LPSPRRRCSSRGSRPSPTSRRRPAPATTRTPPPRSRPLLPGPSKGPHPPVRMCVDGLDRVGSSHDTRPALRCMGDRWWGCRSSQAAGCTRRHRHSITSPSVPFIGGLFPLLAVSWHPCPNTMRHGRQSLYEVHSPANGRREVWVQNKMGQNDPASGQTLYGKGTPSVPSVAGGAPPPASCRGAVPPAPAAVPVVRPFSLDLPIPTLPLNLIPSSARGGGACMRSLTPPGHRGTEYRLSCPLPPPPVIRRRRRRPGANRPPSLPMTDSTRRGSAPATAAAAGGGFLSDRSAGAHTPTSRPSHWGTHAALPTYLPIALCS